MFRVKTSVIAARMKLPRAWGLGFLGGLASYP